MNDFIQHPAFDLNMSFSPKLVILFILVLAVIFEAAADGPRRPRGPRGAKKDDYRRNGQKRYEKSLHHKKMLEEFWPESCNVQVGTANRISTRCNLCRFYGY